MVKNINCLIKPASSLCNLRCRYCFYADIAENREEKSMGIMSQETSHLLLDEVFRTVDSDGIVHFAFQGGEPTVAGLEFFQDFVTHAKRLCPKGVQMSYALQTNGIVLDKTWVAFLRENHFLVGLSMDGCKDIHDQFRVDAHGNGTWNRVRGSLTLLQNEGVDFNVLCVVTAPCAKHPQKIYQALKKLDVRFIQFIACLDPIGCRGQTRFSLTPELYGKFLCQLFDFWYKDWASGNYHSIRLFDDYVNILSGSSVSTCATCGQCGSYFVIEGDGSVYPCDFFVLDRWRLGRLGEQSLEELAQSQCRRDFLEWGTQKPPECAQCRWRTLCNGGCKNDWLDGDIPHNYYCSAFRTFFAYAQDRLLQIADAERRMRGTQPV